jgi:nucleotide-binding universal stress UspA family protein
MSLKIKRILYATDLSQNSAYALRYAMAPAEIWGAEICILYVLEAIPSPRDFLLRDSPLGKGLEKEYEVEKAKAVEKIRERLDEFCRKEMKGKPELLKGVTIQVVEGSPAVEILKKIDEIKPDLLVMGTHGKGFLAYTFLGSVAQKVLHRVKIPVVVVPLPETPPGERKKDDSED